MAMAAEMMKLTVNVPEPLRRRVKAIAALRGESVSDVVRTALETYIAEALDENEAIRAVQTIEARIAAGQERLYSHDEVWAEIEALEAQGALPD